MSPLLPESPEVLSLEDGKYELRRTPGLGILTAWRYGEPWRDLTGDKLVNALMDAALSHQPAASEPAQASIAPTAPAGAPRLTNLQKAENWKRWCDELEGGRPAEPSDPWAQPSVLPLAGASEK